MAAYALVSYLTDSTCNCYSLNPELKIKPDQRRRFNLLVRWNRGIRQLAGNNNIDQLFIWTPSSQLPADLNSKPHKQLDKVLNSTFWRNRHESYTSEVFPSKESKVYASVTGGVFQYYGLPNTATHLSQCYCCSTQFESGDQISSVLRIENMAFSVDTSDALVTHVAAGGSVQRAPLTHEDLPHGEDPAITSTQHVPEPQSGGSTEVVAKRGNDKLQYSDHVYPSQFYHKVLDKFNSIESLVSALSGIVFWVRKWTGRRTSNLVSIKMEVFNKLVRTSQKLFPPLHCVQTLPFYKNNIMYTSNRLDPYTFSAFHQTPGYLPVISHRDGGMCGALLRTAHTCTGGPAKIHVGIRLTALRSRRGTFGTHITKVSQQVKRLVNNCVSCRKQAGVPCET